MCPTELDPIDESRNFQEIEAEIQAVWPGFHHEVMSDLNAGGCGQTVKVCWTASGEPAVLKYLLSAVESNLGQDSLYKNLSQSQWRRFLEQEARIMYAFREFEAAIDVLDLHSSYQAFVMEYVSGGSLLDSVLESSYSLDWRMKVERFLPLLDLLIALQKEGIYHRDLTLDNILLTSDGRLKLADFGLAHNLQDPILNAILGGKPGYVHPFKTRLNQKPVRNDIHDVYSITISLLGWVAGVDPNHAASRGGSWIEKCPDELVQPLMDILLPSPDLPSFASGIGSFELLKGRLPISAEEQHPEKSISWLPVSSVETILQPRQDEFTPSPPPSFEHLVMELDWQENEGICYAFLPSKLMTSLGKTLGLSWDRCAGRSDLAAMLNWNQACTVATLLGLEMPDSEASRLIPAPAVLTTYWCMDKRAENMAFTGPSLTNITPFESIYSRSPYRTVCLVRAPA